MTLTAASIRQRIWGHSCRTCIKSRSLNDGVLVALPPADALPQVEDALEAVVDQDLRGDGATVAGGAVDQKVLVFVSRDFLPTGLQLLERDQYGVLQVSAAVFARGAYVQNERGDVPDQFGGLLRG